MRKFYLLVNNFLKFCPSSQEVVVLLSGGANGCLPLCVDVSKLFLEIVGEA
jgi:hypothetical protein